MRILSALLLSVASVLWMAPLRAQSLADIAKQEQDRRKEEKRAAKVYTNKDLKPVASASAPADTSSTSPQTAAPGQSAGPGAQEAKPAPQGAAEKAVVKDQAYWRKRMTDSREQLDRDRTLADALQTRINSLTTDFVNRDDPAQQAQLASDRAKALNELARLKKAVEADTRAIAAVEEEARRAGVPPGWLR